MSSTMSQGHPPDAEGLHIAEPPTNVSPSGVPPAPGARAEGILVDLPVRVRGAWSVLAGWVIFYLAMIMVAVAVMLPLALYKIVIPVVPVAIGCLFLTSILLGIVPAIQRRRARARARRHFELNPGADSRLLIADVYRYRPWLSGMAGVSELAVLLARQGRCNEVFRLARPREFWPVTPLRVDFEPRSLDETDAGFVDLHEAIDESPPATATWASRAVSSLSDVGRGGILHRVRRNITLKQGNIGFFIFLFFFVKATYRVVSQGAIDGFYLFMLLMMAMLLFRPATGGLAGVSWMLVPGGVLCPVRGEGRRMLFDRAASILLVYQDMRRKWVVLAASPFGAHSTIATRREADMLLRAWLSPVEPPSAAELVGLSGDE